MNHKTKYERKTGLRKMRKVKEELEEAKSKLEIKVLLANLNFILDKFKSSKIYSSANLREYRNVYDEYCKEVYA